MDDKTKTSDDNQPKEGPTGAYALPKPEDKPSLAPAAKPAATSQPQKLPWQAISVIFLSFVAGLLGAWLALASGAVKPNTVINNQEKLMVAEGEVISGVAAKISPSVVSIVTESRQLDIFERTRTTEAAGTGVIISEDGYILTNKHVIPEGVTSVKVVLADGTDYDNVRVVGTDPLNDIAFLKLKNARNLKAAPLADSSAVVVGQRVVAVGNALGEFETTVTSGIISGLSRDLVAGGGGESAQRLSDLLQTDAAINPGNSGGPLVSLKGEVIGINTAIADSAEGIGFAIPIDATKGLIKTVKETGRVARAYIGVQYVSINPDIAKKLNLSVKQGALVQADGGQPAIIDGSPAGDAGLREGDIITKVDGREITRTRSLALLLSQNVPGDTVSITYLRDGDTREAKLKLEELRP